MSYNQGGSCGENGSYNSGGYRNNNSGFALLVVLFILLIIIGSVFTSRSSENNWSC